ncbi:MAG TPA: hypothetical protein EYO01_03400 [Phycisphaerales bacterium]|nr:hypothetical protein [Phycisphaerales bacterium]HIB50255.1 hypothetical protein [Phycisphaerales bacterium]HIN83799.1 hypothetical protein [Phycisphaerales bacterium]
MSVIVSLVMQYKRTIISQWLLSMNKSTREQLLGELGKSICSIDVPVEGIIEQLAAGLLSACANDMGLSPMELSSLLHKPRKMALAGLLTVLHNDA